ncbi:RNA polymerase sigma factor sigma-70 region 4 domain-containing protein [Marinisporobacter balticus]|uniref:Uncharacterized protein n=1 Tax=Marinisporobacter balticus TaxID=2018667 RepID=A0A4R2L8S7_9FIRM|nr:hypothetical protein [Marinisporobacter balticus]TCO79118.1 hypothetical protein EV214_103170 [Marinisporobacter balticus]
MNCIDNYKDLCADIDVHKCIIEDIENELIQLQKLLLRGPKEITGIDYSREPGSGQVIHISMDRILDRMNRIGVRLEVEKKILESKFETRKKIDEVLKGLTGLDAKVAYMRDIQERSLQEISDELGYSYNWISKISSRIGKNKAKHI